MPAMRGHDMQAPAWMAQYLGNATAVEALQARAEFAADLRGRRQLAPGHRLIVLVDVVMLQPLESSHRVVQAGRGHAPGADGGPHQIDTVRAVRQPLAE